MYVGRDEYPESTANTYDLLVRHSGLSPTNFGGRGGARGCGQGWDGGRGRDGARDTQDRRTRVAFVQNPSENCAPGTDGVINDRVICYGCQHLGNVISLCPNTPSGGWPLRPQMTQHRSNFTQNYSILKTWLLIDSCSGVNCANNPDFLTGIRRCNSRELTTIATNGGSFTFRQIGDCKYFPLPMHYASESLTNIVSFADLDSIKGANITLGTEKYRAFIVIYKGLEYKFLLCRDGLYYYNTVIPPTAITTRNSKSPRESNACTQGAKCTKVPSATANCIQNVKGNK